MELKNPLHIILGSTLLLLSACSTAPYNAADSATTRFGDSTMRYGSVAAAAAGAGYAGYEIGGKNAGVGVASGIAGGGLMWLFNKFFDNKQLSAYNAGIADGGKAVRAEILNDIWKRDAVYGNGKTSGTNNAKAPTIRQVYVPTREANGVVLQGGYQEVETYR